MSPSHHSRQKNPNRCAGISPPRRRLVFPIVALTVVLRTAAQTTSTNTSLTRSSDGRKSKRARRAAPVRASRVLPTVMPSVVSTDTSVVPLARSAPRATPGQNRYPQMTSAPRAIPVGGQTAVTFPCV